ncbi:MAG: isochorismatase family protein [Polyangiaceae bacterium]
MNVLHLEPKDTLLLVVDVQERLFAAMPEAAKADLLRAGTALLEGAALLGVNAAVTEQYPEKLGSTVSQLSDALGRASIPVFSKLDFSACRDAAFDAHLARSERRRVVLMGMETHICVFQTARDLLSRGFIVHVVMDGVASRRDDHRVTGLELCRAAGAVITTAETVLFDWLGRAGSDDFRKISKLIK